MYTVTLLFFNHYLLTITYSSIWSLVYKSLERVGILFVPPSLFKHYKRKINLGVVHFLGCQITTPFDIHLSKALNLRSMMRILKQPQTMQK